MAINTEELKLLIDGIIPSNIKENHVMFKKIFDVFFDYISDTYKLGTDSHLLLETDKKLWGSDYSTLNNVDLTEVKRELIKTYLHDYNIFFEKLENDDSIRRYINYLYEELGVDRTFDTTNLLDVINEEEFLIHKKFSQQKTLPLLFNYIEDLINKTGVGQLNNEESYFNMYEGTNYNPRRAFSYTVNTTLFKTIYDAAIKPITHPLGFGYNYYKEDTSDFIEYYNLETEIEDFVVYVQDGSIEIVTYKNKEIKDLGTCSSVQVNSNTSVPQFTMMEVSNLSAYGGKKTDIAGNTFVRTGDKEYKLISDGLEQFYGEINNCELLDWNLDTNSYVPHVEENSDEDIRRDLYGAIVNYKSISLTLLDLSDFPDINSLGDTIGEILITNSELLVDEYGNILDELAKDALYDVRGRQVWIKKWNENRDGEGLGGYYWDRSQYLGMSRDFITFKSTESMYSLEALQLSNPEDNIRIYSNDSDKVLNPYGGSFSFFITLLDNEDEQYIVSSDKENGSTIVHSFIVNNDSIEVREMNGVNSKAFFNFNINERYHIVINWDENGRAIYVNGDSLFIEDDNKTYNEKVYLTDIDTSNIQMGEYITLEIHILKKTLSYQELYTYTEVKEIEVYVDYKKGDKVLLENNSDTLTFKEIDDELDSAIQNLKGDISNVQNQLLRVSSLSKDTAYVTIETQRINNLISLAYDYIENIKQIQVNISDNVTVLFPDITIEEDERTIKNMFDSTTALETDVDFEYMIPKSGAAFEYYTEVNELIIGNPTYFKEQGVSRVNYILDNFDILNRPMKQSEIDAIRLDHDTYVKSEEFEKTGLELYFSQDRKIFEFYHNEMEAVDHCFTAWFIGDTYSFGSDGNLLIQYYNDMANCALVFDNEAFVFGDYIEHDKMSVDDSLAFGAGTVIYENVISVSELKDSEGDPKIIVYLENGTRIEYVKGKYWRHINNENGTLIEEKPEYTLMDYSYQIKVTGTRSEDDTHYTLQNEMGEEKITTNPYLYKQLKDNHDETVYTRKFYNKNIDEDLDTEEIDGTIYNVYEERYRLPWVERWDSIENTVKKESVIYELKSSFSEKMNDYFNLNEDSELVIGKEGVNYSLGASFEITNSVDEGGNFKMFRDNKEVLSVSITNDEVTYIPYRALSDNWYNTVNENESANAEFEQIIYDFEYNGSDITIIYDPLYDEYGEIVKDELGEPIYSTEGYPKQIQTGTQLVTIQY